MKTDKAMQIFRESAQECANKIDPGNHYVQAYPLLLKSTKILCKKLEWKAIPVIANLAYGWMPTIPKNIKFDEQHNKEILKAYKIGTSDDPVKFIEDLSKKPPINNSWVGSSKVLHFINPEMFPIWDTNVAKHFTKEDDKKLSDANIREKHSFYANYRELCGILQESNRRMRR